MRNGPKALIAVSIVGATSLGIWALSRRAAAAPEGIHISDMEAIESGPLDGYYDVIFSAEITNVGSEPQRVTLEWGSNYLGPGYEEEVSKIIDLEPGETYSWAWTYTEVFDYYRGYFTCWLFVDGAERKGVWK